MTACPLCGNVTPTGTTAVTIRPVVGLVPAQPDKPKKFTAADELRAFVKGSSRAEAGDAVLPHASVAEEGDPGTAVEQAWAAGDAICASGLCAGATRAIVVQFSAAPAEEQT